MMIECSKQKTTTCFDRSTSPVNQQSNFDSSSVASTPMVVIFMATFNGQNYLVEQLDSILSQTHKNWKVLVSDDGSTDDTIAILKQYQERLGENKFILYAGPQRGYAANFMSLVCKKNILGDYYAYSDQDDIWDPNKLEMAIKWFNTTSPSRPALYCSRTKLINDCGVMTGYSILFKKKLSFLNALVQNVGGGNTMVFNKATLNLLRESGEYFNIFAHDWWTYLMVTGAGGVVHYDPCPTICYRQHSVNILGSNVGLKASLSRLLWILQGRFKAWNDKNVAALFSINYVLSEKNRKILQAFILARNARFISRVIKLKRLGIYRQTFLGNIGLLLSIVFKKI